ncbi:MAG TPA: tetratricopeptide repeat protein [bacterium]|nr:tetratricopeptide repeat protein [bacterium]
MKRLVQAAAIVLTLWLCQTAMRPFLTQVNLEWGKRNMNQAVKMAEAASKRKKPLTMALTVLRRAEKFFVTAKRVTLGDGQVWLYLAHVSSLQEKLDKDLSKSTRNGLRQKVIDVVDQAEHFYMDNNMLLRRALAHAGLGDTTMAIQGLEEALVYYSTWSQAIRPLVQMYMQDLMRTSRGDPKRILRQMERLVARFPKERDAVIYLGRVYLDQRRPQEARACFKQAEARHWGDITLGRLVAQSYMQEGNYRRAVWELCRVLHISQATESKDLVPVTRTINSLLKQDPKNADAHFIMGRAQQKNMADFNAARREYLAAYQLQKTHFETIRRLAEVCEVLGNKPESAQWRAAGQKILAHTKSIQLVSPSGKTRESHCLVVADANQLSPLLGKIVNDKASTAGKAVFLGKASGRRVPIRLRCPPLPAGDYELSVRMSALDLPEGHNTMLARIRTEGDSIRRSGTKKSARRSVYARDFKRANEYRDFTIKFYHPGLVDFEILIEYMAACDLYVDRTAVGIVEH